MQETERDAGLIPGSGRSPGEGNGNPLQNSCLENAMDQGALWTMSMGSQRVRHAGRPSRAQCGAVSLALTTRYFFSLVWLILT